MPIIMRVMALFQLHFFAKCLHVGEDGPGRGHLCHTDTFLVTYRDDKRMTTPREGCTPSPSFLGTTLALSLNLFRT